MTCSRLSDLPKGACDGDVARAFGCSRRGEVDFLGKRDIVRRRVFDRFIPAQAVEDLLETAAYLRRSSVNLADAD